MEIPPYPEARALALPDKALLDSLFSQLQPCISELTFAGLYLFRKAHGYRLTTTAESIVILGKGYDGADYFMPPLGGDVTSALKDLFADGLHLYGVDDTFVSTYLNDDSLEITELRDSFDYLYFRNELAVLPGSRFHKKKNRINYFASRHEYSTEVFSEKHLGGCLNLLESWLQNNQDNTPASLILEVEAASEALKLANELGLEGIVIFVNSKVVAFALGEHLNRNTAVCHFEKADTFMEGLFQLVNREFSRLLFQDCIYLNREQDLGDMGLRNAKLSYHPVQMVKKYMVKKHPQ